MTTLSATEPLSDAELATAKAQFLIVRPLATNKNATVDVPTMMEGTARLFATIESLQSKTARLQKALRQLVEAVDSERYASKTEAYGNAVMMVEGKPVNALE